MHGKGVSQVVGPRAPGAAGLLQPDSVEELADDLRHARHPQCLPLAVDEQELREASRARQCGALRQITFDDAAEVGTIGDNAASALTRADEERAGLQIDI